MKWIRKKWRLLLPLCLPPSLGGGLWVAWSNPVVEKLENVTVDWRFQARAPSDGPADPRLLIVGIGERSLAEIGRWPWKRGIHREMLEKLRPHGPAAVVFDFLFSEPSEPEVDQAFADELAWFPGAITGASADDSVFSSERFTADHIGKTAALTKIMGDIRQVEGNDTGLVPIPDIAVSAWTGFVNVEPSSRVDPVRRELPLVVRLGDRLFPSMVLQTLLQSLGLQTDAVELELGKALRITGPEGRIRTIPIDEAGKLTINFRNLERLPQADYATLYRELAAAGETGTPQTPVRDRILIFGQVAAGLTDFGPTPLENLTALVKVQAAALDSLLREDFLTRAPRGPVLAGWLALAWISLLAVRKAPVWIGVTVPSLLILGYVWLGQAVFNRSSLLLPVFLPVLGLVATHGITLVDRLVAEVRARRRVKSMFSSYVAPTVVDQMIASGEEPRLGGEECEITAFFSDIQGFSSFSEKLTPTQLVTLMNDYLTEMSDILLNHGGTVDKYIGDAIVGMVGAPLPCVDHAHRGCAAAIEMQLRQIELREVWRRQGGWPEIVHEMQTRIGMNSGPAVIGNMGSRRKLNYTMMGDNVNLAARCESGAKSYGVYTMITGETRRLSMKAKDDIAFRYLDKTVVKGRTLPVAMYEVVGFTADLPPRAVDCLERFARAMERYLAQDWPGAIKGFESAAEVEPYRPGLFPGVETNPSLIMIQRCHHMWANPPGDDWDGVYVMKTK